MMDDDLVPFNDFAIRKAQRLRDAARLARANAEACRDLADEAEGAASDAESCADDWDAIANGDMTPEELHDPSDEFSFDR
jgi:hypothetical protein